MTKSEYQKISTDRKLPLRCPCLNSCARYRYTAYFVGSRFYTPKSNDSEKAMKEMGILRENEDINKMLDVGESVNLFGGSRSFYITNACPEFFLYHHEHKPYEMTQAVHQYSYDEEFKNEKFIPGESRHFSECGEYSAFISKKSQLVKRKTIPSKHRAVLQKEIGSICPLCANKDVGHFEIHHIDEDRSNNDLSNLLMLCKICHSKITKGDILPREFIDVKLSVNIGIK